MSMEREFVDYLKDILDAIDKIAQFTTGMDQARFRTDSKTAFAVIRALEIIGEATKKIPPEIRAQYAEVPWREVSGIRDKLIHEYFGADLDVVWKTTQLDLPSLKPVIEQILNQLPGFDENQANP